MTNKSYSFQGNELYSLECVRTLYTELDLSHQCGYITLLCPRNRDSGQVSGIGVSSRTNTSSNITESSTASLSGHNEVDLGPNLISAHPDTPSTFSNSNKQCVSATSGGHVLLDCTFGLPLFDAQLNERVCQRIVEFGLCTEDAMRRLTQSSRKLALKLLEFIDQHHVRKKTRFFNNGNRLIPQCSESSGYDEATGAERHEHASGQENVEFLEEYRECCDFKLSEPRRPSTFLTLRTY